jgi:hypothetical protein
MIKIILDLDKDERTTLYAFLVKARNKGIRLESNPNLTCLSDWKIANWIDDLKPHVSLKRAKVLIDD